ncbi:ribonuclease H2, subunit C [Desarmillaria tabescens]|uniref:Ribonuclease H2, subunit C n=1 Tax=Armillaria tabescens TaxID=1929756 RepID=A0AA39KA26_ARMTA|nr:ribonuclease H2, subunit C [Desarmillaria tabescens]KAK0457043.1 ribonuclease H2, subunit C [Desarmillaria tabescens]
MSSSTSLPSSSPNLMPFHIEYNGPASISTFFHVEERVTENLDEPEPVSEEPKAESSRTATAPPSLARRAASYFVSSFRGRTLHGTKIDVPDGYTGLVLKGIDGAKKEKGQGKAIGDHSPSRATRHSARNRRGEDEDIEENDAATKSLAPFLTPAAQFSSFILWHPDALGREKDDEYVRSLNEWTKLSEQIHYIPDDA